MGVGGGFAARVEKRVGLFYAPWGRWRVSHACVGVGERVGAADVGGLCLLDSWVIIL